MKKVLSLIRLNLLVLFALILAMAGYCCRGTALAGSGTVKSGVINITVQIQDTVPYDAANLETVKQRITEASTYLYNATHKQNRFGKVTIMVPSSWPAVTGALPLGTLTSNDVDLFIPNNDKGYANVDKMGGTGAMTVGILSMKEIDNNTSGRTLVHEFGHYGYGLYDEYVRMYEKPNGATYESFKDSQGNWLKCTDKVTWVVSPAEVPYNGAYTYPEVPSSPQGNPSSPADNTSSIMWFQDAKPIVNFCYKDHNSKCNNDQNVHNSSSCWEHMVKNSKFSLKLPDNVTLTAITAGAPEFEIRQGAKGTRANLGFYLVAGVDRALYTYPGPVNITATLFRDDAPVRGALVTAVITAPDGTTSTLQLGDDGLKGDSMPGDGTYDGYFVDFKGNGQYSISISASNPGHNAEAGVGFPDMKAQSSPSTAGGEIIPVDFQVQADPVLFTVDGYITKDLIPPGEIDQFDGTLQGDGTAVLTWLAPGNNMYQGQAASYELRYAGTLMETEKDWQNATPIRGLPSPGQSGQQENFTTPPFPSGTYYLALRALDGTGLSSEMTQLVLQVTAASTAVNNSSGDNYSAPGTNSGLCFIATAAYGSPIEPHVKVLRLFRDRWLLTNRAGQFFVKAYYTLSPALAKVIAPSPLLRAGVRHMLAPLVFTLVFPWAGALCVVFGAALGMVLYKSRRRKCAGEAGAL